MYGRPLYCAEVLLRILCVAVFGSGIGGRELPSGAQYVNVFVEHDFKGRYLDKRCITVWVRHHLNVLLYRIVLDWRLT